MFASVGPLKLTTAASALQRFDSGAPGAEGYERWRAVGAVPRLFDVSADPDRFHVRFTQRDLGALTLLEFRNTDAAYTRSPGQLRRDGADHLWVQLVRGGTVMGAGGDRSIAMGAGAAGVCDLGKAAAQSSHAISARAFLVPRDAFGGKPLDDLHAGVAGGSRFDLLDDYFTWLMTVEVRSPATAAARAPAAVAEVVSACFRPVERVGEQAAAVLSSLTLARAQRFIAAHAGDPALALASICRAAGVSRATLYRLFAPHGGVAAYVWTARLEAARRALSDPAGREDIGQVAARHGFATAQHFSRRFREHYGFSPRNLRPF